MTININNATMGGDPQPGVGKTCVISWRYFDDSGISSTRSIGEGANLDFGEPEIINLEYGGVSIMNRGNLVSGLKSAIRTWKRVTVAYENMGGDTKPGVRKQFAITYRRFPGWPMTQFIVSKFQTIYFERQIQMIFYGGVALYNRPFVYASFNRAFQDCFLDPVSDSNLRITNENMGGNTAPGVRKSCSVEIDGWDSWKDQTMALSSTLMEGDAWPRGSGFEIPGIYYVQQGKSPTRRWEPVGDPSLVWKLS